jgi:pimeloyl-ACP methyl ester carboxylesterase
LLTAAIALVPLGLTRAQTSATASSSATTVSAGTLVSLGEVPSTFLDPRRVDVWLPPGYNGSAGERYDVLYMQDGQNLFVPAWSFGGNEWQIDEVVTRLLASRQIRPVIVVGVWNTAKRREEYFPAKAVTTTQIAFNVGNATATRDQLRSDAYLRFLTAELKPQIDRLFRTKPDRRHTFVMGSSMGGLISCYAIAEYPQLFGGAGCVSTHWPAADGAVVPWLGAHLPDPKTHRIWFDHGTVGLDALYGMHQRRMDSLMVAGGYQRGRNWITKVYPDADHSERSWAQRVEEPLRFLLGR